MSETSLSVITQADRLLARAVTIQSARELKGKYLVAAEYAKQMKLGTAVEDKMRTYAMRAERKMGEMLAVKPPKPGPGRGHKTSNIGVPVLSDIPSLAELGVSKQESAKAQKLAELPDTEFESVVSGEKTLTQLKREEREAERENRRSENAKKASAAPSPIMSGAVYATILIDPPWDWGDEGDVNQMGRAKPDYATMTIDQLKVLPVGKMADVDCHLYCWITNRSLPKGFALLDA
jgi:hypothetical protein